MSARIRGLSLAMVAAPLLLCCAATATATRSKQVPAPSEVIELELRELGGEEHVAEFVVPLEGSISGRVSVFGDAGRCELSSRPVPEDRLTLELRCESPQFELRSTLALSIDAPTIIGELESSEGRRLRVVATRR